MSLYPHGRLGPALKCSVVKGHGRGEAGHGVELGGGARMNDIEWHDEQKRTSMGDKERYIQLQLPHAA